MRTNPTYDKKLYLALTALILALILGGCSSHLKKAPWPAHISELQHWKFSGKIGYRNARESGSAYISWENRGDDFTITLNGTFGLGKVTLIKIDNLYHLKSKDKNLTSPNPETLLAEATGLRLPLDGLRKWVTGNVPDQASSLELTAQQRPKSFVQNQWSIRYSSYEHGLRFNVTAQNDNPTRLA